MWFLLQVVIQQDPSYSWAATMAPFTTSVNIIFSYTHTGKSLGGAVPSSALVSLLQFRLSLVDLGVRVRTGSAFLDLLFFL